MSCGLAAYNTKIPFGVNIYTAEGWERGEVPMEGQTPSVTNPTLPVCNPSQTLLQNCVSIKMIY